MPVTLLLVEGELDVELLSPILQPGPAVERGGSKGSLAPKTRDRREEKRIHACYLRDRDFDYEPPADTSAPSIDKYFKKDDEPEEAVLGWRWCRHEIESYLLDPPLVAAATGWPIAQFTSALVNAGQHIAEYTACRWELGQIRHYLAEVKLVNSRPQPKDNEFWLPADITLDTNARAIFTLLSDWRRDTSVPDETDIREACQSRAKRLAGLTTTDEVLCWHGAKDLLAALEGSIRQRLRIAPASLRIRLRDWVRDHPEDAIQLFPEWLALRSALAR